MKVLVTGGAGFIGSHLVEGLLQKDYEVVVADNLATGKKENLAAVADRIEFRELDLADVEQAVSAVEGVEAVLHAAAIPSVPRSVSDPMLSNNASINATLNTLIAARDAELSRFVYAASSAVYGDDPALPKTEDMPAHPMSPYAIGKLTGEYYCSVFYQLYGLPAMSLRYFNVYGPRQDPNSEYAAVIPRFITTLLKGEQPTIYGDGEQSRDFTYVEDIVQANILALESSRGFGETMNVASGDRVSLNELFARLRVLTGSDQSPVYAPARAGDVKHSRADISKAREMLGYEPRISFAEGMDRTASWFRKQMETAGG
jgi:nucleoside-diphosphate-sugar epimerase